MLRVAAIEQRHALEFTSSDLVDLSWTPWRRIMLSSRASVWALVDAVDYDWLSAHVWNEWHAGGAKDWQRYAKRNVGPRRSTVRMHREIMIEADQRDEAFMASHFVDHINGQTLDNRRANLRWTTKLDNMVNRRTRGTAPTLDAIVPELVAGLGPRPEFNEVPF